MRNKLKIATPMLQLPDKTRNIAMTQKLSIVILCTAHLQKVCLYLGFLHIWNKNLYTKVHFTLQGQFI